MARLLPSLILGLLFLSMACTGIPLLSRSTSLVKRFPPGVASREGPLPDDPANEMARHAASPLVRIHAGQGYFLSVVAWLLIPLAAAFPLAQGWRGLRRKGLATVLILLLLLFLLLLIVLESFTGHLIGGMIREPSEFPRGTFLRFTVVHGLGLPLFATLAWAVLFWAQLRVSKRADAGARP